MTWLPGHEILLFQYVVFVKNKLILKYTFYFNTMFLLKPSKQGLQELDLARYYICAFKGNIFEFWETAPE